MKRVLLGLSGGVDSAVAARRLQEQGFSVFAHWLDLGMGGREEAAAVAEQLGIPFSVGDVRAELEERVCKPFEQDYLAGKTPLPCARCNPTVKFPALFAAAETLGAEFVATGHYAQVREFQGEAALYRGHPANDQVYMLARLPRGWLPRLLFPLGAFPKSKVRELAAGYGLSVAQKPDSMEICFIPDGDYAAWLDRRGNTPPPGDFVDKSGAVLGRHKGYHHYTIGQRRGLGISAAARLFVSEIRPESNQVVLSDGSDLYVRRAFCTDINRLADFQDGCTCTIRLRHSKNEYPATLSEGDGGILLDIQTDARAPTPGQLAVFYDGERVLGSGWISREVAP